MITTSSHRPWPGDTDITNHESAGLPLPCIARIKLFTLDNRLIIRRLGRLSTEDQEAVGTSIQKHLG
jgi:mRNA interferase MazF